jgi:hypothetical protein
MKMAVFWVVAGCRLVGVYQRFRLIALMMEAIQTSETAVNSHQSKRRYNPEDSHLQDIKVFFFVSHGVARANTDNTVNMNSLRYPYFHHC